MAQLEFFLAGCIVVLLLGLAVYFAGRQWQTLKTLGQQVELSAEDRRYHQHQARRRLVGCVLMVVFAGMLAGWYVLGMDRRAVELGQQGKAALAAAEPEARAAEQRFLNFFSIYWMVLLTVLLAMMVLAALDILAIRRFGLRHYRQLQSDRRAMLERELSILRSQRNGHE